MRHTVPLFYKYDPTTTLTYARYGPVTCARKNVKTVGSSTTVVENTSGDNALNEVGVGDLMEVNRDGTVDLVRVDAKASDASITVNTAVDWSATGGKAYRLRKWMSGTTTADGWVGVGADDEKLVFVQVDTLGSTSVTATIEAKTSAPNSLPTTIWQKTFLAVTVASSINSEPAIAIPEGFEYIRVGWYSTTDGTDSVTASYTGVKRAH